MIKRVFDLLVSAISLLVLSPFLLILGLLVRLDSPGAAIFKQERVGRHGRPFLMYKFRTMREDMAAPAINLTIGADPRITQFGGFLRRYKLDELPQLVNVFRGEMSLVGPRPELGTYVATYPNSVRELILSVRPGITDPSSIEFRDESELLSRAADPERIYVEEILPRKLALSQRYIEESSILTDIRLIWRTVCGDSS